MTDFKPILQGRPTPGIERLLGSARLDVPRPGGVARTVAALGLASGVTATAGASAAAASTAGASVLVKWLAIGAVTGAVVTGTGEAVRYGIATHEARPAAHRTVAAPAAPARAVAPNNRASLPAAPAAEDETPGVAVPGSPAAPVVPPVNPQAANALSSERAHEATPPVAFPPTLAEEVRALDAVRQLMAAGNARGALRALDEYSMRFTQPRLGPEAALLREQARRLAQKP